MNVKINKKSTNVIERGILLVLREGIRLDEVMDTTDNVLVGRVCDMDYSVSRLNN